MTENVIELSKRRKKKSTIKGKSYLEGNPHIAKILEIEAKIFTERIHKLLLERDKDVSAKVIVSFEFFRE